VLAHHASVQAYCNRKIIVTDCQTLINIEATDKFKSFGIDKCPYDFRRTEWAYDSAFPPDGVDNMTIEIRK